MASLASLVAQTRLYMGGALDLAHVGRALTAEDFGGQTWLPIEKAVDLGRLQTIGEASSRSGSRSGNGRGTRTKISSGVGSYEPRFHLALDRPGQAALLAAEATDDDYAFRLALADAPAGGTPSARYFIATVGGLAEVFGGPNDEPMLVADLWINSSILRVAAAPAPAPEED